MRRVKTIIKKRTTRKQSCNYQKSYDRFISELDKLNKCRLKHCSKYGMGQKSTNCVARKCKRKLSKINRKYKVSY